MFDATAFYTTFDTRVRDIVAHAAAHAPAFHQRLAAAGLTPSDVQTVADLARLPILRKDDLLAQQQAHPPFGGLLTVPMGSLRRVFQSPGPMYEPEANVPDPWRWAPALQAAGFGPGDLVLVAFGYHLTPAGAMFEEGARAVGCAVIPGGIGSQEQQAQAMAALGVTGYIGLPSYLKALLEKAEAMGQSLRRTLKKAFVSAEPLPPSLRALLQSYGVQVFQGYGTAEAGNLGYEVTPDAGWTVPDDALVQVCDLNSGQPLGPGETGEVVVTLFEHAYPLIRFGTGDLSALHAEPCPVTGRPRLVGWLGRAGDAVKVRGMFLHPRQAQAVLGKLPGLAAYQFVITRQNHLDHLTCRIVPAPGVAADEVALAVQAAIRDGLKFRADVEPVESLPADAKPLIDERVWE
ncbi:MAG: AMP-binding protein [Anaerolineae bacterium]|nr:AMP-binding protein [Anaerolineae bacterium]